MSMQDPIADMLTRIRNAGSAALPTVAMTGSKLKAAIAEVLKQEGYIQDCAMVANGIHTDLVLTLKYCDGKSVIEGIERVSKPSRRVHAGSKEIPLVRNGLGIVVLSTPNGVMSGRQAAKTNVGGEILCRVW